MEFSPFLFFILLGSALIVAELVIFNLSVFWFLFIGIGAIAAAIVSWLLPESSWLLANITFVAASALAYFILYPALKRWQEKPGVMPGSDAIGQTVQVLTDIDADMSGKVNWSGASWEAQLTAGSEALKTGDTAEIAVIQGIVLFVKKPE